MKLSSFLLSAFAFLAFVFILAPIVIVVVASFTPRGYLEFPPRGMSLRWYAEVLTSSAWLFAFLVSGALALATAALTTFLCFLAALVTTRRPVPAGGRWRC